MTTADFIDLVVEYVGSGLTPARALTYTNLAQNSLLIGENRLMRILPDPFITTTAGVYQYAASSALFSSSGDVKGTDQYDIYNVSRIYSFNKDNALLFRYNGVGNSTSSRRYIALNERASDEVEAPVDVIKSIEPNSLDCQLNWWGENDPGATTIDWRCEAYRYPAQLTSNKIALSTPSQFQDTLLLWLVLKRLGIRQYGTSNIDTLIIPEKRKFDIQIQKGDLSRSRFTLPIEV